MIPNVSFGRMSAGDNIAQLAMQDRALREQAIRELGSNVTNSINLGFDRSARNAALEKQLFHDTLQAERQRDLTTKLQNMQDQLERDRMAQQGQQFGQEFGLRSELGRGELNLGERKFGQQVKQDDRNYGLNLKDHGLKEQGFNYNKEQDTWRRGMEESKLFNDFFRGANADTNDSLRSQAAMMSAGADVSRANAAGQGDQMEWLKLVSANPALVGVAPQQLQPFLGKAQSLNAQSSIQNLINNKLSTNGNFTINDLESLAADPAVANDPTFFELRNKLSNGFSIKVDPTGQPRLVQNNWLAPNQNVPFNTNLKLDPNVLNTAKSPIENQSWIERLMGGLELLSD